MPLWDKVGGEWITAFRRQIAASVLRLERLRDRRRSTGTPRSWGADCAKKKVATAGEGGHDRELAAIEGAK
jgi:hypothetical protein